MRLRSAAVLLCVVVAGFLLGTPAQRRADAACGIAGPPCQAFWRTPVVFEGTAGGRTPTERPSSLSGRPTMPASLVHFTIEHAYRGIEAGRSAIDVIVLGGQNPDGTETWVEDQYKFEDGRRYVVYAYPEKQGNALMTSTCQRTGRVEERAEDLAYFASLSQPSTGGRIFGRLVRTDLEPSADGRRGGLANVAIALHDGSTRREARTDADGRYQFSALPAGTYRLVPSLPPSMSYGGDATRPIELPDPRACAEVDLYTQADVRLGPR